ncbi:MAG: FecR domain-containing protein, partial [Hydrogenophilaceae bacterium]|nr:FecR domain-containing protein [Hydrogenophilaceae bacterium]
MRHALSLLVLSLLATAASAAPIGRILVAVGDVSAQRNGKTVPLKARAEIELGDLIKTGPASNAQVRLTDGAIIAIKPITEFKFDDYQFSGKQDGTEKGAFSLVKGGFRTITGAIGKQNPQNYKVSTPMANIGIRGTFYNLAICDSACFNPDGSKAEDGLYGGVTDGKIAVTNQAGEKTFGNEEFFHVASANETPQSLIAPPAFLQDKLEGQ